MNSGLQATHPRFSDISFDKRTKIWIYICKLQCLYLSQIMFVPFLLYSIVI